mmetsp:Transcript_6079/g.14906  ORF Transcript_6079/g.14906 Transcript_6079/m.14906 type:complete len:95 (+) Transcript_6079:6201-6485(+)
MQTMEIDRREGFFFVPFFSNVCLGSGISFLKGIAGQANRCLLTDHNTQDTENGEKYELWKKKISESGDGCGGTIHAYDIPPFPKKVSSGIKRRS